MADASRELVGPDIIAAVGFESYPSHRHPFFRDAKSFIKGGFQDYEGLGIKSSVCGGRGRKSALCRSLADEENLFPDS